MSMIPGIGSLLSSGVVTEAMGLGRRAVAALERQAELMAEPENDNETIERLKQEALAQANGQGYTQAKLFFGQKLEDILDGGYIAHERAEKLRQLSAVMNGKPKEKK